jgi:cytochrome c biogenesis protein CcdA/thiol-disulfide isomerase/thioredoxin
MTLFFLAFLAGVLTVFTPCIFPILPFVLAGAEAPFRRGGLPMLLGLAFAFAGVASLAAVAGNWAVQANHYGRIVALVLLTLFGLALIMPGLAARLTTPFVAIGARLADRASRRAASSGPSTGSSLLLGVATGLVWAPCAGPVLGLILTGAALNGPGIETSLFLLAYGLGAATSLGAGLFLGGRLLVALKTRLRRGVGLRRILGIGVVAGAAAIWLGLDTGMLTRWSTVTTNRVERGLIAAMGEGAVSVPGVAAPFEALRGSRAWLNSQPLAPEDLRGRVVLVNFWTYSCINCLRTLPYLRSWAEKYRARGLVVLGVHTPEFAFEKEIGNVRMALAMLGIHYPVVSDNGFAIWRAFGNQGWPGFYFIDANGRVREHVSGEGNYERSERLLQQLLAEAGGQPVAMPLTQAGGVSTQAAPDWADLASPETYIGYRQARSFISQGVLNRDVPGNYRVPATLPLNQWGLTGIWTIGPEFATLDRSPGSIAHRFHARDLHLVLAPRAGGGPIRFRVLIDGAAPGADHGYDTDAEGWGQVREDRLYQLVRQRRPVADRSFEIRFFDPGVRAYAFTFG